MTEVPARDEQKPPDRGAQQSRATVLAQLPGRDMVETVTVLRGELGAPHHSVLPVLTSRADTAGTIPRTVSVLTELWCDLQPHGWRLTRHPGKESRAAESLLASDVNALADVVGGESTGDRGPVTVEITGPVTLAAELHLHNGERVLQDHGARRDVAEALADGLLAWLPSVVTAVEGRPVVLRLDEPQLTRVVQGQVPTASGYRTLRAVARQETVHSLRAVTAAARQVGATVEIVLPVTEDPRDLDHDAADSLLLPRPGPDPRRWESLAASAESGMGLGLLIAEMLPRPSQSARGSAGVRTGELVRSIVRPWHSLGLPMSQLDQLTVAPASGLQDCSPAQVRQALKLTTDLAHGLHQTALEA